MNCQYCLFSRKACSFKTSQFGIGTLPKVTPSQAGLDRRAADASKHGKRKKTATPVVDEDEGEVVTVTRKARGKARARASTTATGTLPATTDAGASISTRPQTRAVTAAAQDAPPDVDNSIPLRALRGTGPIPMPATLPIGLLDLRGYESVVLDPASTKVQLEQDRTMMRSLIRTERDAVRGFQAVVDERRVIVKELLVALNQRILDKGGSPLWDSSDEEGGEAGIDVDIVEDEERTDGDGEKEMSVEKVGDNDVGDVVGKEGEIGEGGGNGGG